ncbi:3-phosphoserine/phosphohydroxythreonine transaminase [Ferruginibacter lapsinanis]|uniref:3-phosphoserine/phosphohydroxythreonine transaminase n=1 Tax=Ferruginibacter lapsinanis TaxID=563172 RepID=UPI001E642A64|nr:3-phosphoserine/phosphohydroxythreonine transaminase [Ferruginibacter lapsinanis]UEG51053.1 3-phosphoserine/phosphohydroxythreonine transaminase [Ferruginibacter lapsinanis]
MIHNFNAGPSILPKEVFQQASEAVLNYNNTGLSILEIGHRTSTFQAVMDEAVALVKELMQLDADHEVLFLHGGASTQFMQVPMNLLDDKEVAAYSDTGVWGGKAIKEAKLFGKVEIVCTGKESNYTVIPKDFAVPNDAKYFHITTNETIYGCQWQKIPKTSTPLVGDMSSDILSRVIDYNAFDLIYAGAQKNMGAAGVNLVVVNKNILGKVKRAIPTIMDYRNHIKEGSMLNTPPVFAVYVCMLTLRWLKSIGGVAAVEKLNIAKADLLYNEIDANPLFKGTVSKEDRSKMNICFVMNKPELEEAFLAFAKEKNIVGIKGHRLVGGFRASLYNALPISSVEVLVNAMKEFAEKNS